MASNLITFGLFCLIFINVERHSNQLGSVDAIKTSKRVWSTSEKYIIEQYMTTTLSEDSSKKLIDEYEKTSKLESTTRLNGRKVPESMPLHLDSSTQLTTNNSSSRNGQQLQSQNRYQKRQVFMKANNSSNTMKNFNSNKLLTKSTTNLSSPSEKNTENKSNKEINSSDAGNKKSEIFKSIRSTEGLLNAASLMVKKSPEENGIKQLTTSLSYPDAASSTLEPKLSSPETTENINGESKDDWNRRLLSERRPILPEKLQHTKEIIIKQGRLKGVRRVFSSNSGLRSVDQYLGLPYAEAPVGTRRFMPPGE